MLLQENMENDDSIAQMLGQTKQSPKFCHLRIRQATHLVHSAVHGRDATQGLFTWDDLNPIYSIFPENHGANLRKLNIGVHDLYTIG